MSEKLSLEQIKEILVENMERYGLGHMSNSFNRYLHEMFSALKMMEGGQGNHIKELLEIDRYFDNIRNTVIYSGHLRDEFSQKKIDDIEYILNYNGVWNKDYFYKKYSLTENDLKKKKETIRKELYPSDSELRNRDIERIKKQKEEKEEYIEKYYEKKAQLTSEDIKNYSKKEIFFSKKEVNEENVSYPLVIKLYKEGKIIYMYIVKDLNLRSNFDYSSLRILRSNFLQKRSS